MSEEIAVSVNDVLPKQRSIIDTNGRNEKLLEKIQSLKIQNLTSFERIRAKKMECKFINAFTMLSWNCGGLSKTDLYSFSEDQLRDLDEHYMSDLIRKSAWKSRLFYFSNPIGWLFGIVGLVRACFNISEYTEVGTIHCRINYAVQKWRLKKMRGKDWFPAPEFLKVIKKEVESEEAYKKFCSV